MKRGYGRETSSENAKLALDRAESHQRRVQGGTGIQTGDPRSVGRSGAKKKLTSIFFA